MKSKQIAYHWTIIYPSAPFDWIWLFSTDSNDEDLKQQLLGVLSCVVPNFPEQAASNWTVERSSDGLESGHESFQPKVIDMQTTIEAIPLETNEAVPVQSVAEGKYTMSQELSSGNETQEAMPAHLSQRHDEEPINMQGWKKQCFLLMLCCPNLLFRRQLLH